MRITISNQAQLQAMQAQLDDSFDYVRKTFFHRWDRKHEWSCAVLDGTGRPNDKPIGVWHFVIAKGRDHIEAALIIEICHVVTRGRGRRAYMRRLMKVAEHAFSLGRRRIADMLSIVQFAELGLNVGNQHGTVPLPSHLSPRDRAWHRPPTLLFEGFRSASCNDKAVNKAIC